MNKLIYSVDVRDSKTKEYTNYETYNTEEEATKAAERLAKETKDEVSVWCYPVDEDENNIGDTDFIKAYNEIGE